MPFQPPGTRVGGSWRCPPIQYLLVDGIRQQRAQLSLGCQALVTGTDLGAGVGTEGLQEAISLPRERCCSRHSVTRGAIPRSCSRMLLQPRAPAPSGTQPEPKSHPESSSRSGQPQALLAFQGHIGLSPGMPGRPSPPRDGQRCRTTHQRHGDSRPCPDPPTGCPSLPPPWLGGLRPLAASWHPAPPGSSAACRARSPARPGTGTPGPSPAPAVRGDGTGRHQV